MARIQKKGFAPKITNGQWFGAGVYLAPDRAGAKRYGDAVGEFRVELKKPFIFDVQERGSVEAWYQEIYTEVGFPILNEYGEPVTVHSTDPETLRGKLMPEATEAAEAITGYLKQLGHDGVLVQDRGKVVEIVVFDPAQVKSTEAPAPAAPPAVEAAPAAEKPPAAPPAAEAAPAPAKQPPELITPEGAPVFLHGTSSDAATLSASKARPNQVRGIYFSRTPSAWSGKGKRIIVAELDLKNPAPEQTVREVSLDEMGKGPEWGNRAAERLKRMGYDGFVRGQETVVFDDAQVKYNPPISAAAVDAYGIKLPEGYIREGDRYVFKGEQPSAPATAEAAPADSVVAEKARLAALSDAAFKREYANALQSMDAKEAAGEARPAYTPTEQAILDGMKATGKTKPSAVEVKAALGAAPTPTGPPTTTRPQKGQTTPVQNAALELLVAERKPTVSAIKAAMEKWAVSATPDNIKAVRAAYVQFKEQGLGDVGMGAATVADLGRVAAEAVSPEEAAAAAEVAPAAKYDFKVEADDRNKGRFRVTYIGKSGARVTAARNLTERKAKTEAKRMAQELGEGPVPTGHADVGGYAPPGGRTSEPLRRRIPQDQVVAFMYEVVADYPDVVEKMNAAGRFYPETGAVKVRFDVAQNPVEAAWLLCHEILGHLYNLMPDRIAARGNLLGRLAVLQKYLKHWYEGFSDDAIRAELRDLSMKVKPFDPSINPKLTAYRFSSDELFADAMAVFAQDPALLEHDAPQFWKALHQFMDRRPQAKALYDEIQARLGAPEDLAAFRQAQLDAGQDAGNARRQELARRDAKSAWNPKSLALQLLRSVVDERTAILRGQRLAKLKGIAMERWPYDIWQEYDLVDADGRRMLRHIEALRGALRNQGVTQKELHALLFLNRIAEGDRAKVFNAYGFDPASAAEQIQALKSGLTPAQVTALETAANSLYDWWSANVLDAGEAARVWSPEQLEAFRANRYYVTYLTVKHIGDQDGRVHAQVGAFDQMSDALHATVEKALMMNRWFLRQEGLRATVLLAAKVHGEAGAKPAAHYSQAPPEGFEVVRFQHEGKQETWFLQKDYADAVTRMPLKPNMLGWAFLWATAMLKKLYVQYNPTYLLRNPPRDVSRTWLLNPEINLWRAWVSYLKAMPDAYRAIFKDISIPDIEYLEAHKALVGFRSYDPFVDYRDAMDRTMAQYHLMPDTPLRARIAMLLKNPVRGVRSLFEYALDRMDKAGIVQELSGKLGPYRELVRLREAGQTDLTDNEILARIRGRVGTPSITTRGAHTWLFNNIKLYSNVGIQGWRGHFAAFKEAPLTYSRRMAMWTVPKLILWGGAIGLLGETWKKIIDGIPEYNKTNDFIIPIGMSASGKSVYLRLPQDESQRLFSGVMWKLWNLGRSIESGEPIAGTETTEINKFVLNQLPGFGGWNAILQSAWDAINYAVGTNPTDEWYGKPVIDPRIFEAGGFRSHAELLKHIADNCGVRGYVRFKGDTVEEIRSEFEKLYDEATATPGLGPIVASFVGVSDRGLAEQARAIGGEVRREAARRSLDLRDRIIEAVNAKSKAGQPPTLLDAARVYRQARTDKIIPPRETFSQFLAIWRTYATRAAQPAAVEAVQNESRNEAKARIMFHYKRQMKPDEWRAFARILVQGKHAGPEAFRLLAQMEAEARKSKGQ